MAVVFFLCLPAFIYIGKTIQETGSARLHQFGNGSHPTSRAAYMLTAEAFVSFVICILFGAVPLSSLNNSYGAVLLSFLWVAQGFVTHVIFEFFAPLFLAFEKTEENNKKFLERTSRTTKLAIVAAGLAVAFIVVGAASGIGRAMIQFVSISLIVINLLFFLLGIYIVQLVSQEAKEGMATAKTAGLYFLICWSFVSLCHIGQLVISLIGVPFLDLTNSSFDISRMIFWVLEFCAIASIMYIMYNIEMYLDKDNIVIRGMSTMSRLASASEKHSAEPLDSHQKKKDMQFQGVQGVIPTSSLESATDDEKMTTSNTQRSATMGSESTIEMTMSQSTMTPSGDYHQHLQPGGKRKVKISRNTPQYSGDTTDMESNAPQLIFPDDQSEASTIPLSDTTAYTGMTGTTYTSAYTAHTGVTRDGRASTGVRPHQLGPGARVPPGTDGHLTNPPSEYAISEMGMSSVMTGDSGYTQDYDAGTEETAGQWEDEWMSKYLEATPGNADTDGATASISIGQFSDDQKSAAPNPVGGTHLAVAGEPGQESDYGPTVQSADDGSEWGLGSEVSSAWETSDTPSHPVGGVARAPSNTSHFTAMSNASVLVHKTKEQTHPDVNMDAQLPVGQMVDIQEVPSDIPEDLAQEVDEDTERQRERARQKIKHGDKLDGIVEADEES